MNSWQCNVICSTLAGMASAIISQPLETIKVQFFFKSQSRIQVFPNQYSSIYQSVFKIIKEENIRGLYKGYLPGIWNQVPVTAM